MRVYQESLFLGGAAAGAVTVATVGSAVLTGAGVTLGQVAASDLAGLTIGTATNQLTDPDSRPRLSNKQTQNQCGGK